MSATADDTAGEVDGAGGDQRDGPLSGLLVADFSRVLAGPMATMTLADLGATVVKVERPGSGDETRGWGPPYSPTGPTYFESVNRTKRSVTLDLTDAGDRAAAAELARRCDVLVENFLPGTMRRYGLGYDEVAADNPGVVYCSISGFGSGPGAALPGYDFVVQAVGGLMSITGQPDGDPTKVGVALVDVLTGKDAVIGILAGLAGRERTGRGTRVEVTLLTSLLAGLVNQAQAYLGAGVVPGRMGNRHPSITPYETLHCREGLLAVGCGNDAQFGRLTVALGVPALAADERFARNADRVRNRAELVDALETALAADTADGWQARLADVGVPAGQVGTVAEAVALAERLDLAPTVTLPDGGRQVRHPVRYDGWTTTRPTPPPALGADGDVVRAWLARRGATVDEL